MNDYWDDIRKITLVGENELKSKRVGEELRRHEAALRRLESLPNAAVAKPRLGDHYADLGFDAWRKLLFSGEHNDDVVRLASWIFLGRAGATPRLGWCDTRRASLIGDARAFGALKYGNVRNGWHAVPLDDHLQSAGRHFDAWLKNSDATDEESKLPHEAHFLARAVRVLELREIGT